MSASEAAAVLEQEAQRFEELAHAKAKKLAPQIRNALVELAPSLQAANDLAVERDPEVLRCEWVNRLKDEIEKLSSKRVATSTATFSPDSFVGSFIKSRKKSKSPLGRASHPRGDDHEAENGEYVVSSSSSDESSSGVSSDFEEPEDEPPAASPAKAKGSETTTIGVSDTDPSLSNPLKMTAENRAELTFVVVLALHRFCTNLITVFPRLF